jgi:hypothetical protein
MEIATRRGKNRTGNWTEEYSRMAIFLLSLSFNFLAGKILRIGRPESVVINVLILKQGLEKVLRSC